MSILHVSKSRVQLQEAGCICRYDIQGVLHALYTGMIYRVFCMHYIHGVLHALE